MRSYILSAALVAASITTVFSLSGCSDSQSQPSRGGSSTQSAASKAAAVATCEHGVQSDICARCNPRLEAVFRAQNDWCEEHTRPESQCALCNPEVARQGIK